MAENDHIPEQTEPKGRLTRSSDYRTHGHTYVLGSRNHGTVYGKIDVIQTALQRLGRRAAGDVEMGSPKHAERYTFPYLENFKVGYKPYANEAHHMLPCEAFSETYLSSDQRRLLEMTKYDVNQGANIVFLPAKLKDTVIHHLPYHNGSHPKYTAMVVSDMASVRKNLQKALKSMNEHETWSPPDDIPPALERLQDEYWAYLTSAGTWQVRINDFEKPPSDAPPRPPRIGAK